MKPKKIISSLAALPLIFSCMPQVSAYAEDIEYLHSTFENGTDNWTGRGMAAVTQTDTVSYKGSYSLYTSGRTAAWNGASIALGDAVTAGGEYSFSANVKFTSGGKTDTFYMKLQYVDSEGKVNYSSVAEGETEKDVWIQLANTDYKIPEDATEIQLYIETADSTNSFYVDEVVISSAGTAISGAGSSGKIVRGDINSDGVIDVFDMIAERGVFIDGTDDSAVKKAADIDGNGSIEVNDLVLMNEFLMGMITEFPQPPKPDNKWDEYTETASQEWIDFYESSICNMGNTYRLVQKLEAAENGEPLTVAYLGGSITEGKNYSSPFSAYVQETFANGSFTEVNAGLSGTSSVVGLVRSERDVASKSPDIIFLEFSVNDHEGELYKKAYESLVKKFLSLPNEPAVAIIITRSKGGYSSQQQMEAIGKNFDLPIISMNNALTKAFDSGLLQYDDYYTDEYHPHEKGGKYISDCMGYYFRKAMKTENRSDSYAIPETFVYGSEYYTCANAMPEELENFNAGSFTAGTGYASLPYGYTFQKYSPNNPLTFKTQGKGLIIVFKANSSGMGNLLVTVNGKTTKISGNKLYTWGGPDAELGYYQNVSSELDVSMKMENSDSDFTIWGIGVIK